MRARQVDEFGGRGICSEIADVTFDGDARVVADALLETRQPVKERALAAIGGADNRDTRIDALRYGYLVWTYADFGLFSHQPLRVQPGSAGHAPGAAIYRNRKAEIL